MPNKQLTNVVLDVESFYDTDYTLKKLTPIEYIRDPRFHLHGVGIAINKEPAKWFTELSLKDLDLDWGQTRIIGHNLLFDSLVVTERLGIYPAMWCDTLSLSKSLLATPKHNLDFLASLLLKSNKIKGVLGKIGQHYPLTPEEDAMMAEYCLQDVNLTRQLYELLAPHQTPLEARVLSTSIRWFAEPTIELDTELLETELLATQQKKEELIAASGWSKTDLSSNSLFVKKLESDYGLVFPTKPSPTNGNPIHATGKSDPAFIEFKLEHPEMRHIWEARSEVKSTLGESRIKTLTNIAKLGQDLHGVPSLPVPLNYFGAHTGRFSGAMKINLQNLPSKRTSNLRICLRAPKDHVLVVSDSAQIELRVTMWFTGQHDLHHLLATGNDLYKWSAMQQFGIPIEEVSKEQRQFGKVCELGLSYGMGHVKFQHTCASGPLGMDPIYLTPEESRRAVNMYRESHPHVRNTWGDLNSVIYTMLENGPITHWRGLKISKECIELPDGVKLRYPLLAQDEEGNFMTGYQGHRSKVYGSLLLENLSQALARSIIAEQIIAVEDKGYRTVFMCHDEIVTCVHKDRADECLEDMIQIMSTTPKWAPGLVLSADGGHDVTYSK